MKHLLSIFLSIICCAVAYAQSVQPSPINPQVFVRQADGKYTYRDATLDEKSIIAKPISGIELSSKAKLEVGQIYYLLQVARANDITLIGKKIACEVIERRKSNISGSEGRLVLRPLFIKSENDQIIRLLPTDIYRRGLNRQSVKFWSSWLFFPMAFVPGTGAKISSDEVFTLRLE